MTKVIFFGNERLISGLEKTEAPILNGLIEKGYDVVAVVSHHSQSQSRNSRDLEVSEVAQAHDIPLFLPHKPSEILEDLRSLNADVAVLAAYGRIVSQQIIDLFPLGIINVHPSLLPQYRGPTPIESAILNGDHETGVSIMQLSAGMDEGPVYAQKTLPISNSMTKFELYSQISNLSTALFFDSFPSIIGGTLEATPQSDKDVSYSKLLQKSDGAIDWNESALQIERKIRAYEAWPQSRTSLSAIDIIITAAHVVEGKEAAGSIVVPDSRTLLVGTSDGLLSIDMVKPLGKKEMPVSAFLSGYQSQLTV